MPPRFLYGQDLQVRPGGERDFTDKTPRVGVEFYHDVARNIVLAVSDKGWIAASANAKIGTQQICKWLTAHDLHARKADEKEFTIKTRKYGVEVYQDLGTQQLLYVCESGAIALTPIPAGLVTDRGPLLHHALTLKVRRPEQSDFAQAPAFGLESFSDENTPNTLLYIVAESGSISAVANQQNKTAVDANKVKTPDTLYGLILRVRRAEEKVFTDRTRRLSLEVYRDTNTAGHLLYLSETGAVAAVPATEVAANKGGVAWLGGMALRVRPAGERDFKKARQYQIEVFRDNRTGCLVYICETGSIAVVSQSAKPASAQPPDSKL
jgi:hypothetical protein